MTTTFAVCRPSRIHDVYGQTGMYTDRVHAHPGSAWVEHSWSMSTGNQDKHGVFFRRYRNPMPEPRSRHAMEPLADWERELLGEERVPRITFEVRNEW